MNALATETLHFGDVELTAVHRDGQRWLPAADIARALGYSEADSVTKIYNRRRDEFSDVMALTVNLTVRDSVAPKPVRIFSPRGAHLIAMFAKTATAKAFRAWVLDVLDSLTQEPEPPSEGPRVGEAERVVMAGRCFNAYLRAARALGVSQSDAALRANHAANQRTGVDLVADLGLAGQIQARSQADPDWQPRIEAWLDGRPRAQTVEILSQALGLQAPHVPEQYSRLAVIMETLGYRKRRIRVQGRQGHWWVSGRSAH